MTAPSAMAAATPRALGVLGREGETVEQWRALASRLAARGQMRLSHDRSRNYPARLQCELSPEPPDCPAAVHIYDTGGMTRLLAADFDAKRASSPGPEGAAANAAADAAAFARLIRSCGGRSFGDLSPQGGRHGYVIWAEPLPYTEMYRIALALARRYPTFDPKPMLGLEHGIITIPGSRHRSGGVRALTTPLAIARQCLDEPCAPAVWERLHEALAAELEAVERGECPQRPPTENAPDGSSWQLDASGAPWIPRPGGRIGVLRPDLELTAITGAFDTSRRTRDGKPWTPSEARFAVLGSAAARGWQLSDVTKQITSGAWPGLAGSYQRYHPGAQRQKALRRDWKKAVAGVSRRKSGRPCHTRERHHRGGRTELRKDLGPVPGDYADIRRWDCAIRVGERYRWHGPHAITIRLVLRAVAAAAQMTGSTLVEFGCRSLGLLACVDHSTVARVLAELCAEEDPYLVRLESRRGLRGDLYMLRVPAAYADAAAWSRWRPGRLGVHPVFRVLGGAAALVCEQLASAPVRAIDLPVLTGLAATTVSTALAALAGHGIAVRGPAGWHRGPADLDDVAALLGIPEMLAAILARHRQERRSWRTCLTAAPRCPPAACVDEDVPWPEAPTRDEFGEAMGARPPPDPEQNRDPSLVAAGPGGGAPHAA